jgi:hypothetical protein
MRLTMAKALMLPSALLALGGLNRASAATCAASYSMTAVTAPGFSCTLGALTFSNFEDVFTGTGLGASTPDPGTDVTVNFAESMSGTDPFGTVASASAPIYSVIADYTAGNTVGEFQSDTGVVQYLVTDALAGTSITEVDAAISGLAANTATGALNKTLCANGPFEEAGTTPNGVCSSGSELTAASVLALSTPASTQADGTPDWVGPFALSTMGVYDDWALNGGTTLPTAAANITSVENDFIETTGLSVTPEPGGFVLFGGALVGLGIIRRRRPHWTQTRLQSPHRV